MYFPDRSDSKRYCFSPGHSQYGISSQARQLDPKSSPGTYAPGNRLVDYAFSRRHEKSDPAGDDIEALLQGRKDLLRSKINLLLIQLEQRRDINREVIDYIEQDSCHLGSLLMQAEESAVRWGKERLNLEKQRLDLKAQKRMESVNYFRDTALLNKELKDALLEYQKETQNENLFTSGSEQSLDLERGER